MSTPDVSSTVEVEFVDITCVVPVWWSPYMADYTVTFRNNRRVVSCTRAEMQEYVNQKMTNNIFRSALRRSARGGR
jgi:hypothetical protein